MPATLTVRCVALVLIVGLSVPARVRAQPSSWRFDDAVQRALRLSPALRGEHAQRDAALAQTRAARARQLPVFSTNLSVQRNPQLNAIVLPAEVFGGRGGPQVARLGTGYESNVTRTLTVPLVDAGQRAAVGEGDAAVRVADARMRQSREDLVLEVTDAYVNVLVRQRELYAARVGVETRMLQRIAAESGLRAGRTTSQQVDLLRLAEERTRTTEIKAKLALHIAQGLLGTLLSAGSDSISSEQLLLRDSLPTLLTAVLHTDSTIGTAISSRGITTLEQTARADEDAAAATRLRERRAGWPTLRLVGSLSTLAFASGLRDVTVGGSRFTRSSIGLQFEPPTFDFGIQRAKRAEADARWRFAAANREAVERRVTQAERTAWLHRESARLDWQMQRQERVLRGRTLELCIAEEHSARGAAESVAQARLDLAESEVAEARAIAALILRDAEWRRLAARPLIGSTTTVTTHGGSTP